MTHVQYNRAQASPFVDHAPYTSDLHPRRCPGWALPHGLGLVSSLCRPPRWRNRRAHHAGTGPAGSTLVSLAVVPDDASVLAVVSHNKRPSEPVAIGRELRLSPTPPPLARHYPEARYRRSTLSRRGGAISTGESAHAMQRTLCGATREARMRRVSKSVFAEFLFWGCNPGFVTSSDGVLLIDHPDYPPNPPTRTFSDELSLDLGGQDVRILHTPGHTAPQTAVYLPAEGVVFTGDNVFHSCKTWLQEADPWQWLATLERIGRLGIDLI